MDELIDVLKTLSNDMHKGDTALFELCEKMINQIVTQEKQILALLENQRLLTQVVDSISTKVINLEAYRDKKVM